MDARDKGRLRVAGFILSVADCCRIFGLIVAFVLNGWAKDGCSWQCVVEASMAALDWQAAASDWERQSFGTYILCTTQ